MFPKCRHCGHDLHEHEGHIFSASRRCQRMFPDGQQLKPCRCPGYEPAEDTGRARLKIA